jgi:hypothetical protein
MVFLSIWGVLQRMYWDGYHSEFVFNPCDHEYNNLHPWCE